MDLEARRLFVDRVKTLRSLLDFFSVVSSLPARTACFDNMYALFKSFYRESPIDLNVDYLLEQSHFYDYVVSFIDDMTRISVLSQYSYELEKSFFYDTFMRNFFAFLNMYGTHSITED